MAQAIGARAYKECSALKIEGVDDVSVKLNAGGASRVEIRSSAPIADAEIQSAVEEAGYTLARVTS